VGVALLYNRLIMGVMGGVTFKYYEIKYYIQETIMNKDVLSSYIMTK